MTQVLAPPALTCRDLSKAFGPVLALDAASFDVRRGEILVLLGPSGCGKTTALRLIAGLERPDEGEIAIDGAGVAGPGTFVPPERRRVGLVFQHYALFPHLSVAENVAYGLGRAPDRAARVAELLASVSLDGLADRMPYALSGGQQQRVALVRALAPRPALLLLDEPFSNLDARLRGAMRDELRAIIKAAGTTAVFVTHDQEEALVLGDRIAVLRAGRVEQLDTPEGIFHAPRTRFVAEFFGHTRFLPARVAREGLATELGCIPQRVALPEGSMVEVLVRPDDLLLLPPGAPTPMGIRGARGATRAVVLRRAFQGMHNLYLVALPSGQRLDCLAPHTLRLLEGSQVRVLVSPGHALACFADDRAVVSEQAGAESAPEEAFDRVLAPPP